MQKVTYVNAYGESVVFGGEPPVLLRSAAGFSKPDSQVMRTQGAYGAGELFSRIQLPSRSVQIQFDIPPLESREAMYRERMRIERVLSSGRSVKDGKLGTLIYENDAGAWTADAVPEGKIDYGKRFLNGIATSKARFYCPDAYLKDRDRNAVQLRMGKGGMTLPTRLPLTLGARKFRTELVNRGTADAPVHMTVHGTGEMPAIQNHTTGARIVVSRTVATGERLEINTDPRALTCVLHRTDGTTEDAFGYLDPSIAVSAFLLVPGSNDVEYMPSVVSTGSRLEIVWQSYYEGV